MELIFLISILLVGCAVLAGLAVVAKKLSVLSGHQQTPDQAMLMLQQQLHELNRTVDTKMVESTRMLQDHFGQSARIISDVTEKLTKLDETNRQVLNFSDQLQRLQDILRNPKQRGIFGEYQLELLLRNAFQPGQYKMQYKFADGLIVDAALFLNDKIIPIDSKFSLENYNRIVEETDQSRRETLEKTFKQDLKDRIDETAKYVRPEEGTVDFALMFIPAEGVFYDLLINRVGALKMNTEDLIAYAIGKKRVHIVSPTTFYVMLQSILQGMKGMQIQEQTKELVKNIGVLGKHLNAYEEYFAKLGSHLGTAVNMYNAASKEFKKVDTDIVKIAGGQVSYQTTLLDKPSSDV